MSDIILHQYPESPFSEKIRLLLGYKGASYKSVNIPIIMPKPDLMPLTGGYRKTPVMQIGAEVYCDSAIISRVIDGLYPDNTIYPEDSVAASSAMANWTDTFFFKVAVAMAFLPTAAAGSSLFANAEEAAAFVADRAQLTKGSDALRIAPEEAQPYFHLQLKRLDIQLSTGSDFLFGDVPTIADFSTYHCLWFCHNNEALKQQFSSYGAVETWLSRMAAFGHGDVTEITGAEALESARSNKPDDTPEVSATEGSGLSAGDDVEIMPIDYGFDPVRGKLTISSLEELALVREDDQVGKVGVHFPRLGFQVRKV